MASTINAGTSTGTALNITTDTTGALNIQTSGVNAISISSAQAVTLTNPLPAGSGGTGLSSLGTGVATALGQNVTGSGSIVLGTSPTLAGTPLAPTAAPGTNTTQIATTAFVTAAAQALYPVGSIYINATSATNPATLLGFGTWTAFGAGRVMVGLDASDALFDTAEETGGSKDAVVVSHTHSATSTDSGHTHTYVNGATNADYRPDGASGPAGYFGATGTTNSGNANITTTVASTGSSGTNANVQPYITVYMWKRTA